MKKLFVTASILGCSFLFSMNVKAQVIQEWVNRYNGVNSISDYATAVDIRGCLIVAGTSSVNYSPAFVTIRLSTDGDTLWTRTFISNGTAKALAVDDDCNIYVTGEGIGGNGLPIYLTVKYDPSGTLLWSAQFSNFNNSLNYATVKAIGVAKVSGNVYVTGMSNVSDITLQNITTVKYDSAGNFKGVVKYNGSGNGWDETNAIVISESEEIYVTGWSAGFGTRSDFVTIKYDSTLSQIWARRYDRHGIDDQANALVLDDSANVYVTGFTSDNYFTTIKYRNDGTEEWRKENMQGVAKDITIDGSIINNTAFITVTGLSITGGYMTIRYDATGTEKWVSSYNSGGPATAISADGIGNVYITGYSTAEDFNAINNNTDYATVAYDSLGNQKWVMRYDGSGFADVGLSLVVEKTPPYSVYVTGNSLSATDNDIVTIKYNQVDFAMSDTDICVGGAIDFTDISINGATNWNWTFVGGFPNSFSVQNPIGIVYDTAGTYDVTLIITYGTQNYTIKKQIIVNDFPIANAGSSQIICTAEDSVSLMATGGTQYEWLPVDGLSCTNCQSPMAHPSTTTVYTVTVTNNCGIAIDEVTVTVGVFAHGQCRNRPNDMLRSRSKFI